MVIVAATVPGWTGLFLASVRQAVDLIPLRSDPFGAGFEAMLVNGIPGAAGLAMILPMIVPSRWRTRETGGGGQAGAGEFVSSLSEPAQATPAERPKRSIPLPDTTPGPGPAVPATTADQRP